MKTYLIRLGDSRQHIKPHFVGRHSSLYDELWADEAQRDNDMSQAVTIELNNEERAIRIDIQETRQAITSVSNGNGARTLNRKKHSHPRKPGAK